MENSRKIETKRPSEIIENSEKTTSYQSSKEINEKRKVFNKPITFDNELLENFNKNKHMLDLKQIRKNMISREKINNNNSKNNIIHRASTSHQMFRINAQNTDRNYFIHNNLDEHQQINKNLKNHIIKPQLITFNNKESMNFIEASNFNFFARGVNPKYNDSHLKT